MRFFGHGFDEGRDRVVLPQPSQDDDFEAPDDTPLENLPGWEQAPGDPAQPGDLKVVGNVIAQERQLDNGVAYVGPPAHAKNKKASAALLELVTEQGYVAPRVEDADNFVGTTWDVSESKLKAVLRVDGVSTALGEYSVVVTSGQSIGGIAYEDSYYIVHQGVAVAGPFSLGGDLADVTVSGLVALGPATDAWLDDYASSEVAAAPTVLAALSLSSSSVAEDATVGATVGAVQGKTTGSTLTLQDSAGGKFALDGDNLEVAAALDYETATSHNVTIRETLAGADNSPRDTVLTVTVTDVSEGPNYEHETPSPKRHWRILIRDGGNVDSATEIEMRTTPGGADATSPGITCAMSSTFSGNTVDRAFDNNTGTSAVTGAGATRASPQWIRVDFGAGNEKVIEQITWRNGGVGSAEQAPHSLSVQYADDAAGPWTTYWTGTNMADWGGTGITRTFTKPASSLAIDISPVAGTVTERVSGNTLTPTGNATVTDNWMVFDGDGDYYTLGSLPANAFDVTPAWTLHCFLRKGANTGFKGVVATQSSPPFVLYTNAGHVNWIVNNAFVMSAAFPHDDTPHHVAVVRDEAAALWRLFIDGVQVTSSAANVFPTYPTQFRIGVEATTASRSLDGKVDDVKIAKKALWTANFTPPVRVSE